jgi:peptidoglycan/LPS O-acetylase OafA/YrhL
MKSATPPYLDLIRSAAALTVFIEHLREDTKIGFGAFWALIQTAITIFFALSGYTPYRL